MTSAICKLYHATEQCLTAGSVDIYNMFLKFMLRLGVGVRQTRQSVVPSVTSTTQTRGSVCLPGSEWSRDGWRPRKAAVLAGVGLVSPDLARVRLAQTGVGRNRDSSCYKRYMYTIYMSVSLVTMTLNLFYLKDVFLFVDTDGFR